MIFQLSMIGTEDEAFVREYEVLYTMTLLDFHQFICEDLRYDPMTMASFFASNERWEKGREFTLMDMGAGDDDLSPIPMERATLGQVLHHNHDRLIYLFDLFGERGLFLELMGTRVSDDDSAYPRVARSEGEPPAQFDLGEVPVPAEESIFESVMDDFYDFEGDDFYEDDF
jgi:hypothetical protein